MAKNTKMLTAVVRDRDTATRIYDWLQQRGFSTNEINILMSDRTHASFSNTGTEGKIKSSDKGAEGVAAGGAIGTAVGATLAAVVSIGTAVAIPGIGVVAGPLVAALAGGGAGAVTGGLVGGLIGLGISESNAKAYEEALKSGGVVFGVVPGSSEEAKEVRNYLEKQGAENIVYADRS